VALSVDSRWSVLWHWVSAAGGQFCGTESGLFIPVRLTGTQVAVATVCTTSCHTENSGLGTQNVFMFCIVTGVLSSGRMPSAFTFRVFRLTVCCLVVDQQVTGGGEKTA
jgi:hypothetical protein